MILSAIWTSNTPTEHRDRSEYHGRTQCDDKETCEYRMYLHQENASRHDLLKQSRQSHPHPQKYLITDFRINGCSTEHQLDGRAIAQNFLDSAGDQCRFGPQLLQSIQILIKAQEGIANQVGSSFVASDSNKIQNPNNSSTLRCCPSICADINALIKSLRGSLRRCSIIPRKYSLISL